MQNKIHILDLNELSFFCSFQRNRAILKVLATAVTSGMREYCRTSFLTVNTNLCENRKLA